MICAMIRALAPRVVVETGSYIGMTTRRIFETLETLPHGSSFYTIEMDPERAAVMRTAFEGWRTLHPSLAIHPCEGDALAFLNTLANESVDFIFLDDDHTAQHVAEEVIQAKRVLRPGGVCVVHDVIGPFGLSQVITMAGGVCLPFVRLHAAGGLGVVVK